MLFKWTLSWLKVGNNVCCCIIVWKERRREEKMACCKSNHKGDIETVSWDVCERVSSVLVCITSVMAVNDDFLTDVELECFFSNRLDGVVWNYWRSCIVPWIWELFVNHFGMARGVSYRVIKKMKNALSAFLPVNVAKNIFSSIQWHQNGL